MEFVRTEKGFEGYNAAGEVVAEITYRPTENPKVVIADHTFVDDSLRGQGVAQELLDTLVAAMKAEGKKIKAECSYVVAKFQRDSQYDAVNADMD